jgi:hypothetical protein
MANEANTSSKADELDQYTEFTTLKQAAARIIRGFEERFAKLKAEEILKNDLASKAHTSSKADEEIIYDALGNFRSHDNRRKSQQAFVRIKERITELEARVASLEPCWWNKREHSEGSADK